VVLIGLAQGVSSIDLNLGGYSVGRSGSQGECGYLDKHV
jgi:hypothetical protein